MVKRTLLSKFREYNKYYQVICITGPRQSGKSTFIQDAAKNFPYINLESPDEREFALTDPQAFLKRFSKGAIIDEVQYAPELFSYIQAITDADKKMKYYLTGSQNFQMHERVSQSLAGRVGELTLLPFSFEELVKAKLAYKDNPALQQFTGFYPRIYDRNIPARDFYRNYVNTYLERDVQGLIHTSNLAQFTRFISLVAGRAGQIVNYQSLAADVGISGASIQTWIKILERSYVIFLLQPYHTNFNKRITKSPKLYFYDTGLLCYLLGITQQEQLTNHYAKGAIFENYVIAELMKMRFNRGLEANAYFWKNNHNQEIDCLIDTGGQPMAIEIKSAVTFSSSFFDNIKYWKNLDPANKVNAVVYGGDKSSARMDGLVVAWNALSKLTML